MKGSVLAASVAAIGLAAAVSACGGSASATPSSSAPLTSPSARPTPPASRPPVVPAGYPRIGGGPRRGHLVLPQHIGGRHAARRAAGGAAQAGPRLLRHPDCRRAGPPRRSRPYRPVGSVPLILRHLIAGTPCGGGTRRWGSPGLEYQGPAGFRPLTRPCARRVARAARAATARSGGPG